MRESIVTLQTRDTIEIKNPIAVPAGQDQPSVFFHSAVWQGDCGGEPGIAVEVFGPVAPLISASAARTLAEWFNAAADDLEADAK